MPWSDDMKPGSSTDLQGFAMKPEVIVIAGPSGSGKSRHFGAKTFGIAFFNVDDCCTELNGGSYYSIPIEARAQAQRECE